MPNPISDAKSAGDLLALVTERDARVLMSIAEFRLLSTVQIQALHFAAHASPQASVRAVWTVLRRLEERHLIRRVSRQRRFPQGGSTPITWALDAAGERLTRLLAGDPDAPRRRNLVPHGDEYHHTLTVAETYVNLVRAHRAGQVELIEAHGEPAAWRKHPGQLGRAVTLKPDLVLITQTPGYRDHWFVEIDLGNQPTPRLIRKCNSYEDYRASGIEQRRLGLFPRVLWVLPDERGATRLRRAIAAERRLKPAMFVVTTPAHLIEAVTNEPPTTSQAAEPGDSPVSAPDPARGPITKHRADASSGVSGTS